jgi:hypothetical protein
MTSRLARFPRGVERLDLDVLSLDDAASFLLEATDPGRRRAADDTARARALAEALGRLALALEMAAATIDARGLSFAKYQEMWQGYRARVVGWARPEITGYHHAVAETWQTSVDHLTKPSRYCWNASRSWPRTNTGVAAGRGGARSDGGAGRARGAV